MRDYDVKKSSRVFFIHILDGYGNGSINELLTKWIACARTSNVRHLTSGKLNRYIQVSYLQVVIDRRHIFKASFLNI